MILLALSSCLWLPPLLLALYALGVQIERGGWWLACWVFAIPAHLLSFVFAHTWAALVYGQPDHALHEWTFSVELRRLRTLPGWRGALADAVARLLNRIAPSGHHV